MVHLEAFFCDKVEGQHGDLGRCTCEGVTAALEPGLTLLSCPYQQRNHHRRDIGPRHADHQGGGRAHQQQQGIPFC